MQKAIRIKKAFQNQIPTIMNPEGSNMWGVLGKMIRGIPDRKPEKAISTIALDDGFIKNLSSNSNKDFFIWLGHSSVFVMLNNVKILIDPVFSPSASPFSFIGPKAFPYTHYYQADQFPELDIVMISHDHFDHLDKKAIQVLATTAKHFIVPLSVGRLLRNWGVSQSKIIEMDWTDTFSHTENLKIIAQSGRHFSGRGIANRNTTLWCSYILQTDQKRIFFSGDSGYGPHFKEIGNEHGPFNISFLECGQYNENWPYIHMMPEETVQAAIDLKTDTFVPIHWGKFPLSLHPWDKPPKRATAAATVKNQKIDLPTIGQINYLSE